MGRTMTARTKALGAAAGVFGLLGVTACGGSGVDAYCDVWEEMDEQFSSIQNPDPSELGEILDSLESGFDDAVSAAPEDIEQETANMRDAIAAINDIDIDFDDPSALMDPELEDEMMELQEQFMSLEADASAVEDYVNENCENVNLD